MRVTGRYIWLKYFSEISPIFYKFALKKEFLLKKNLTLLFIAYIKPNGIVLTVLNLLWRLEKRLFHEYNWLLSQVYPLKILNFFDKRTYRKNLKKKAGLVRENRFLRMRSWPYLPCIFAFFFEGKSFKVRVEIIRKV